jgi:hypothetical protein
MFPGIWFGKLQDGTECSVVDWHCFDIPVVQVARVRVPAVMLDEAAMGATQALRKRHPELNRQELPALYASTRFARYNVPEEEAVKAVVVNVQQLPYSKSNRENGDEHVLQFITKTILHKHPGSFSRLGWRIDIFYAATTLRGDNTITAWFVFSVAHSIADGPAMHVIVDDYLQAFGKIQQSKLPFYEYPVEPLPLYSSQPRDRLPFSKFQLYTVLIQSLFVGFLLMILPLQVMKPKLLTPMAAKHAQQVQRQRIHDGMPQRSGPFHIDILEMTVEETQQICMHAHAVSTTVGSLLMGCLFVAVSKRYFQEHPSKQILSLLIPVPVNMRPHMIPPLSTCVLAPQQGNVTITLFTSRDALEIALHSDIAMTAFMQDFARSAQTQVHKALHPSERLAVADSMLVVSNLYRICFDKFRTVQYVRALNVFVVDHCRFFIPAPYNCCFNILDGRHLPLQYWPLSAITAAARVWDSC